MANYKHTHKNTIYTRNIDPILAGTRLGGITLFNQKEEEYNLFDNKRLKLCLSLPTLASRAFQNEASKLDILMKDFLSVDYFIISNEPVFTQKRLSKPLKLEKAILLSDFKNREYARATGTYIYELGQLVKAIFLLDKNARVIYVKYYDDLYSNIDLNTVAEQIKKALER